MAIKYVLVKSVSRIKKLANDLAKRAEADKMREFRKKEKSHELMRDRKR